MRKILLVLVLSVTLITFGGNVIAAVKHDSTWAMRTAPTKQKGILKFRIKELEKIAGRKFTLKEKIEMKILAIVHKTKFKTNKSPSADPRKQGELSFYLALAALVLFGLAFIPWAAGSFIGIILLFTIPILAGFAFWLGLRSARHRKNFKNVFAIIIGGAIILLALIVGVGALAMSFG